MNTYFDFALLAFTSLFTMVNPLGVIPVYGSLTSSMSTTEARGVAFKAVFTALMITLIFAFTGEFLFNFFQISVNSLRVVGGVIFFMTGYDMLQARLIRTKSDGETEHQYASDIAITPLAIPMICGPGAITVSIVLMSDSTEITQRIILIAVIVFVMVLTLLFLLSGRKILKALGESGSKVLMRIMGLIVMVIAVEFLFAGLKPMVKELLSK